MIFALQIDPDEPRLRIIDKASPDFDGLGVLAEVEASTWLDAKSKLMDTGLTQLQQRIRRCEEALGGSSLPDSGIDFSDLWPGTVEQCCARVEAAVRAVAASQ